MRAPVGVHGPDGSKKAFPHTGDWLRAGACGARETARFFQPDGDPRRSRRQWEARAVAVCAACPVRPECAAYALSARERCGIWGGLTEADRVRLGRLGWLDVADPRRRRVDVRALERRLEQDRCQVAAQGDSRNGG